MTSTKVASLVSTQWLKKWLSGGLKKHRILDTSWGMKKSGALDYVKEHIPGSLFYDLNRCVNPLPELPRNLPESGCFGEYMRTLGISHDTHIILYDRGNMLPAARTWWNLKAYGHDAVSVLDGGLGKWMSEGQPTESGPMSLPDEMGNFEVNIKRKLIRDFEGMRGIVRQNSHQVLDARKPSHFAGDVSEPSQPTISAYEGLCLAINPSPRQTGHIPGAVNIIDDDLLNTDTKCLLPKEKLIEVFQSRGVDLSKPIVTMCYNGNAACVLALAATVSGSDNVAVYYGSWTEYGYRAKPNEVEAGPDTNPKIGG